MKENQLRVQLQELRTLESKEPGAFRDGIRAIKQEIETYEQERYRGALIRARAEAWAMGEMPTKRALGIEKAHMRRNHVEAIKENDIQLTTNRAIANAFLNIRQFVIRALLAMMHLLNV